MQQQLPSAQDLRNDRRALTPRHVRDADASTATYATPATRSNWNSPLPTAASPSYLQNRTGRPERLTPGSTSPAATGHAIRGPSARTHAVHPSESPQHGPTDPSPALAPSEPSVTRGLGDLPHRFEEIMSQLRGMARKDAAAPSPHDGGPAYAADASSGSDIDEYGGSEFDSLSDGEAGKEGRSGGGRDGPLSLK